MTCLSPGEGPRGRSSRHDRLFSVIHSLLGGRFSSLSPTSLPLLLFPIFPFLLYDVTADALGGGPDPLRPRSFPHQPPLRPLSSFPSFLSSHPYLSHSLTRFSLLCVRKCRLLATSRSLSTPTSLYVRVSRSSPPPPSPRHLRPSLFDLLTSLSLFMLSPRSVSLFCLPLASLIVLRELSGLRRLSRMHLVWSPRRGANLPPPRPSFSPPSFFLIPVFPRPGMQAFSAVICQYIHRRRTRWAGGGVVADRCASGCHLRSLNQSSQVRPSYTHQISPSTALILP